MSYAIVVLFVALFLFAEFKQECRMTRIARNENLTYGQFLAMTWDDPGYRASYFLLTGAFVAVAVLIWLGFRWPEAYLIPAVPLGLGGFLRFRAWKRWWSR